MKKLFSGDNGMQTAVLIVFFIIIPIWTYGLYSIVSGLFGWLFS